MKHTPAINIREWQEADIIALIEKAKALYVTTGARLSIVASDGTEYVTRYTRLGTPIGDAVASRRKVLDKDATYMSI